MMKKYSNFSVLTTLVALVVLFVSSGKLAAQRTPPAQPARPATTESGPSAWSRELGDQLRRSRSSAQRTQRQTQDGRQGLLTMNLTGMETFGDALGTERSGSGDTYTVIETVTLGSGLFINSNASNAGGTGIFTAEIGSLSGAAPYTISQSRAGGFAPGSSYTSAITSVPSMLTDDVAAYLGRGAGTNPNVSASAELIAYAAAYGLDPSQLVLNASESRANFVYPASGAYAHASDFTDGQIVYDYTAVYDIPIQSGGGGMYGLGRQKISENMTPLPTDRFIFDYSYFHGVPLSYRKMGVNRFTPGFEKTFWNKRFSFEMRLPFATTIDGDFLSDNSTGLNVLQLGDMTMTLKYLFYRTERLAMTLGLSLSVPLADDMRLLDTGTGRELIRRRNQTCHLMPYFGLLYLPSDRTFFQAYFQVDAVACGDSTSVANLSDPNGGMIDLGKVRDRTFAYTSMALGYWVKRHYGRDGRIRRGMNLIGELHWTQSLDRASGVTYEQNGHFFNIGRSTGNYSVLNMTIGSRFLLNEKTSVGAGYALPLSNGTQKQFDGEFRLTFNRYF